LKIEIIYLIYQLYIRIQKKHQLVLRLKLIKKSRILKSTGQSLELEFYILKVIPFAIHQVNLNGVTSEQVSRNASILLPSHILSLDDDDKSLVICHTVHSLAAEGNNTFRGQVRLYIHTFGRYLIRAKATMYAQKETRSFDTERSAFVLLPGQGNDFRRRPEIYRICIAYFSPNNRNERGHLQLYNNVDNRVFCMNVRVKAEVFAIKLSHLAINVF